MAEHSLTLRQRWISKPALQWYRRLLPPISATEQAAIDAGTVWWDADLFSGKPNWAKWRAFPKPALSAEEQAFVDGPTETLCTMLDDWQIRRSGDMPKAVWDFIREQGFVGLIIPKEYGGKGFSALAHSQIVLKIASRCTAAGTTVMVPNSLGPAELLLRYGTDAQRNYYLPRLAKGEEIPCFALTAPEAGSDAASIPDHGTVCYGEYEGKRTLGIRLTWNKRYITLAPVATLLGLAFRLSDPDHILGPKEDIGITLALVPTNHPGVEIGRRHFPAGQAFQNGPTSGNDVFIPMDWLIGGKERAGQGWRMLMDCLAAGRAITLPALGTSATLFSARLAGAYARVRRQFGIPIGRFEGIEEPLARIAGYAYLLNAARRITAAALDSGEQPSVLGAILKYHATNRMRIAVNDAMDIHGGRAVQDGPRNYMFSVYQSVPVGATVEGANILTRSLMIFGQGALRCHPHLLKEMEAAALPDEKAALIAFDKEFFAHLGDAVSNVVRAFLHNLTLGAFAHTPEVRGISGMYRRIHAAAVTFAAAADVVMGTMGGAMKQREMISARMGDVLSELYLMSCAFKRYEDDGLPAGDLPLVEWNCCTALYNIQTAFDEILTNLPNRPAAWFLRLIVFPLGRHRRLPPDRLTHICAQMLTTPGEIRDRLTGGIYVCTDPKDVTGRMEHALLAAIDRDAIEAKVQKALGRGAKQALKDLNALVAANTITAEEAARLTEAQAIVRDAIDVDDFDAAELKGSSGPAHSAAAE